MSGAQTGLYGNDIRLVGQEENGKRMTSLDALSFEGSDGRVVAPGDRAVDLVERLAMNAVSCEPVPKGPANG